MPIRCQPRCRDRPAITERDWCGPPTAAVHGGRRAPGLHGQQLRASFYSARDARVAWSFPVQFVRRQLGADLRKV